MKVRYFAVVLVLIQLGFSAASVASIDRFWEWDPGRVYRGSLPSEEVDYLRLKEMGIKTIVNLMNADEQNGIDFDRKMAKKYGFQFVAAPLPSTWMSKPPFLRSFFSKPSDEQILLALRAVANPQLQPVFVHCKYGKDRTGVIGGIYRVMVQGWTKDDAYSEARSIGFTPLETGLYKYWRKTPMNPCSPLWVGLYGKQDC